MAILHKCKTHTKRTGNVSFCFTKTQLVEKPISQIKVHKNKSFRPPFSKGGGFQRQSLGRSPQTAKSLIFTRDQEGSQNNPVDCFGVGNPIKGFPRKSSILYNLTIVVYFFDRLRATRLGGSFDVGLKYVIA